jgi:hypothetical protein
VRFTLLLASSALAASLVLSACSGGTSSVPTGSQSVAPMGHSGGPQLILDGANKDTTCPSSTGSSYVDCYDVKTGKNKFQWCIVYSGETSCSSKLYPGTWTWTKGKVYQVSNGKKSKGIKSSWKPDPGNPTENTIKVKKSVGSTGGAVGYYTELEACNSNGSCVGPDEIGIVVQ